MHHLYLNMIGNVLVAFKGQDELKDAARQKGGSSNLAASDIFDFQKYL